MFERERENKNTHKNLQKNSASVKTYSINSANRVVALAAVHVQ